MKKIYDAGVATGRTEMKKDLNGRMFQSVDEEPTWFEIASLWLMPTWLGPLLRAILFGNQFPLPDYPTTVLRQRMYVLRKHQLECFRQTGPRFGDRPLLHGCWDSALEIVSRCSNVKLRLSISIMCATLKAD